MPRSERKHRFSFRLFGGMLAAFVVVFGAELAIDLTSAAAQSGRPLAQVWPEIGGSWLYAEQTGACLARAGYCMLFMCLAAFLLSIPLMSTFYTPKLVENYLRDPVNRAVFALGLFAAANTHFQTTVVWSELRGRAVAGWSGFYPHVTLWTNFFLLSIAWAVILPYAIYALRYLTPEALLERAEQFAVEDLDRAARGRRDPARSAARSRQEILDLGNMALRAIDRADRDLALDAVRALGRVFTHCLDRGAALPDAWFRPRREWFAGLSDAAFRLLEAERSWAAHLILHQIWLAYYAALGKAQDAASGLATEALRVVNEAARRRKEPLVELGLRFANGMIREVVKRGDPVTVQDVARVHRATLAALAGLGGAQAAEQVVEEARHLAYYCGTARALGAHASADVLALSLARLAEIAVAKAPRALVGVAAAVEALADPPAGKDARALVKARALAASCLAEVGHDAEAARLLERLARAAPADRAEVRGALVAATSRTDAGREAFGAEAGLEFVPEPRRSRMIAALGPV